MPQVDHLILLVHDLDTAAADFRALGFTVQERADTSHGSTAFRFVSFDDGSYILITTFTSPEAAKTHRLAKVLAEGEGWADYSFAVPDVAIAAAKAKAAGATIGNVHEIRNVVQSGEPWSLKLLVAGRGADGDDALPFLIEDTEGRSVRIPPAKPHANGATGIKSMVIGSDDPARTATALGALVGTAAAENGDVRLFDMGGYNLIVAPNTPELPGRRTGGGLASVILRGAAGSQSVSFDAALTHRALLSIES